MHNLDRMLSSRTTGSSRRGLRAEFTPTGASTASSEKAYGRRIDVVLTVAVASSVCDVMMTWFALSGGGHGERNPLMRTLFDRVGLVPVLALVLLVRVVIAMCLALIARRAVRPVVRRTAVVMFVGVTVWWCAIVFVNSVVIGRSF